MSDNFLFKDSFNEKVVKLLSASLKNSFNDFDKKSFDNDIISGMPKLELLERSNLITETLKKYMPDDFQKSCGIILNSLDDVMENLDLNRYENFIILPLTKFIADEGIAPEYFELSMDALYEMTIRFTSEFAIRFFIIAHTKKTLDKLYKWTQDDNHHVRRLASEGTRPRLPWAMALPEFKKDPKAVIKILEKLKNDPTEYVRRSVANNLNDISKDNPNIVTELLNKWKNDKSKEMHKLIRHALRTLLKQGNTDALELLGYSKNPQIEFSNFAVMTSNVKINEKLEFSFDVKCSSNKNQKLMIDYIIHFMKANGKTSPKVFKLSKRSVSNNDKFAITKKHPFKIITTRKLYSGEHQLEVVINGKSFEKKSFYLELD